MENSILGQCPENAAAYDYRMYDRIWQRVSPELDPYPEVRAETAGAVPPAPAEPPAPAPVPPPHSWRARGGWVNSFETGCMRGGGGP